MTATTLLFRTFLIDRIDRYLLHNVEQKENIFQGKSVSLINSLIFDKSWRFFDHCGQTADRLGFCVTC